MARNAPSGNRSGGDKKGRPKPRVAGQGRQSADDRATLSLTRYWPGKWAKVGEKNHLTIMIQHVGLLCASAERRRGKFYSNYPSSWARRSRKGRSFSKDKPVLVREEARRRELGGRRVVQESGLRARRALVRRDMLAHQENRGRNSISIGWASEVSFRDSCGAPFDTRAGCGETRDPLFPGYIFIIIDLSPNNAGVVSMKLFASRFLIMGAEQRTPGSPWVDTPLCQRR